MRAFEVESTQVKPGYVLGFGQSALCRWAGLLWEVGGETLQLDGLFVLSEGALALAARQIGI